MRFIVTHKASRYGKYLPLPSRRTFETEAAAWDYVGSLDQDGYVDRVLYHVEPARG